MRKFVGLPLVIAIVVVAALLIGLFSRFTSSPGVRVPVVVYLVDTLRADRIGLYGYDRPTTPTLDSLAAESVVFERAYAPASWTVPSVASLFTSMYSCEHGVTTTRTALGAETKTLAERLSDLGFETSAFIRNPILKRASLGRGFAEFRKPAANRLRPEVEEFLGRTRDRPFFLYLHTMEPHDVGKGTPLEHRMAMGHVNVDTSAAIVDALHRFNKNNQVDYAMDQPLGTADLTAKQAQAMAELDARREAFDRLYDAAVLWADRNLADTVDLLKASGVWDQAIFVFLSDHGEEIGDHGGWGHGQSVYEELIRVPLLIHFPQSAFGGTRVTESVSLVDIMPTIFEFLGEGGACDDCRGRSLMDLVAGSDAPQHANPQIVSLRINQATYYRPWAEKRGHVNVALRAGPHKGIWNEDVDITEIYDLESDPLESIDLAAGESSLALGVEETAARWLENCRQNMRQIVDNPNADRASLDELRAIGYFE
jgi:arylsulfatase A-like enzyme